MASNPAGPESPLESPSPPSSPDKSPAFLSSPQQTPASPPTVANMTSSSTPLGAINAARRPPGAGPPRATATPMSADIAAKLKAFTMSRSGPPSARPGPQSANSAAPAPQSGPGGIPAGFKMPPNLSRPVASTANSSPAAGKTPSMSERRGMKLPGGLPGQAPASNGPAPGRRGPGLKLSQIAGPTDNAAAEKPKDQSAMEKYKDLIDTKRGAIRFPGKAVIHGGGVEFANGRTFSISLDEVDTMDELGKGNYGTVFKARHARPKIRKPGQGLAGNKARGALADEAKDQVVTTGTTGMVMAIKEIRLELDDAKFAAIIMELDILHRCVSPFIVDFYGAFFQEGAVYICMEWMDGGSIDKIYGDGVPENVLRKITLATVQGLKSLKEEHNIIHRDVKPTNILMNTRGHVKICDFGVSGNLVASIAKTNIGCQSYMAPERISSGGVAQAGAMSGGGTYSVQSDIWSLGLTIIESALGRYPYPPETYDNIFSQLAAIVDGEPPDLPSDRYSTEARDFVAGCLNKIPKLRPTYARLLEHPWLGELLKPDVITEEDEEAAEIAYAAGENIVQTGATADSAFYDKEVGEWVIAALERKKAGKLGKAAKPALHAVALDAVSPQETADTAAT